MREHSTQENFKSAIPQVSVANEVCTTTDSDSFFFFLLNQEKRKRSHSGSGVCVSY
jgi:hypothetical protein